MAILTTRTLKMFISKVRLLVGRSFFTTKEFCSVIAGKFAFYAKEPLT
jgi:hypothetical protein